MPATSPVLDLDLVFGDDADLDIIKALALRAWSNERRQKSPAHAALGRDGRAQINDRLLAISFGVGDVVRCGTVICRVNNAGVPATLLGRTVPEDGPEDHDIDTVLDPKAKERVELGRAALAYSEMVILGV